MGGPLDWFKKIYESEKKNFNRGLNRIKKEGIIQGSLGMVSDGAEMMLRDAGLGKAADAVDEYTNYEKEKFKEGCEKLSKKGVVSYAKGVGEDVIQKFDIIGGNSQNSQAAQNGEKGGIKILSDVAQELGVQKGGEPQLTGQYAVANAKLNVSLATRTKESNEPVIEEAQVRTSSSRPLNTPELER